MWNKDRVYGVYRQASGIIPKTYTTGPDYDAAEENYRCARDAVLALIKHMEEIKTYEHGGPTYKALLEGIAKVKGKTKVEDDDDLSDNMYKVGENVFESLAKKSSDKKIKDMALQIKNNYGVLSKTKHSMNKKLAELLVRAKHLKKESIDIDNERTKMKNAQFDCERLFESKKKNTNEEEARNLPEVKKKADKFNELKDKCHKLITDFLSNPKHMEVLSGINDVYKNYFKETSSELK